jgi:hypothetical protein
LRVDSPHSVVESADHISALPGNGTDGVEHENAVFREPFVSAFKKLTGGELRRDGRALRPGGISIDEDDVVGFAGTPDELAPILNVDAMGGGFLDVKELFGDANDIGIDVDAVDVHVGIVMLVSALDAAAAESDHGDAFDLRIPDPREVKELDVFEVPLQGIGEGHARFLGAVETEDSDAALIDDADAMVGRKRLKHDGGVQCGRQE